MITRRLLGTYVLPFVEGFPECAPFSVLGHLCQFIIIHPFWPLIFKAAQAQPAVATTFLGTDARHITLE